MPRRAKPWGRRLRLLAAAFLAIFVSLIFLERVLSAVFPFPRGRLDELQCSAQSVRVRAADGILMRVFATREGERVLPVELHEVPIHLRAAVLHAEDERFFSHRGVDVLAAGRALIDNLASGRVVSGASTITMQVVRILMPGAPRTFAFKVEQMFRARQLERILSKAEILAIYLSHVPLGGAVRGFDAASRRWFGVGAKDLTPAQAATLVVMLPAPSTRSPRRNPALLRRLRDGLLAKLGAAGDLAPAELDVALHQPLGARRHPWTFAAPQASIHFKAQSRDHDLRTRLDLGLQRRVQELATSQLQNRQLPRVDGVAIVVLDRCDGSLRAMVGTPDFATSQVNAAICPRAVGSTLKPFLYALAMERGVIGARGLVDDTPTSFSDYRPANFSRDYVGRMVAAEALASSRNLPAVRLLRAAGAERFADLLRRLGLAPRRGALYLDAALGTSTAAPLALARAWCRFIENPEDLGLRSEIVGRVLRALSTRPLVPGWVAGRVAFKTGTSSGQRDAWCVGSTADFVVVAWLGNLSGRGEPGLVGSASARHLLARVVDLLAD